MAKTDNKAPDAAEVTEEEPVLAANVNYSAESDVTEAQSSKLLEDYNAGKLTGHSIRFVTRGGITVPVFKKLGK